MSWSSTSLSWLKPRNAFLTLFYVTLLTLSFSVDSSSAISAPVRLPASPGYQGRSNACPTRCAVSGPNPANWSMYHNFDQLASCRESLFYSFSFLDPVDDASVGHHIYACTSFGPDWGNLPANTTNLLLQSSDAPEPVNGTYQVGYWPAASGSPVSGSLGTLASQLRQYLVRGFGLSDSPTILFARYGSTSVGLFIGQGLENKGIGENVLSTLESSIANANATNAASVAMQFCEPGQTSHHVFGLIATGNGTFAPIQDALSSWSKAKCLTFPSAHNITAEVPLVKPLFNASSDPLIATSTRPSIPSATPAHSNTTSIRGRTLTPRSTCSTTVQVVSGNCYDSLASECGITEANFLDYNNVTNSDCDTLVIGEHFCCSAGTLPDYAPQVQSDGTCATYTIQSGDNCETIAASYGLTMDELEDFNDDTWGWAGCSPLYANTIICLSEGTAPMPAAMANAECGPQVPGTVTPPSGTNISTLNECPLNACCDVWGQCGITSDFCTDTSTGAPGTAKNNTNGCISNCGTDIVQSDAPATYRQIGFFEGYNLQRPCLTMDISQIDLTAYTHIYFSFGVLDSSYEVQIPNDTTTGTTYEFGLFTKLLGTTRVLSIGGWSFSTDPSTYMIFRDGVTAANRLTMATNIANFINDNDLDGVNIDWEYPGATDIPGIPAASSDDGTNYLAFLAVLRNLMPDKEITIAAPASYWYLQGFPISEMAELVDYIIYMTYDLHGQWDSNNQWSQDGCPTGTCLRTDVNITETDGALSMITKAGVPSNQVVVGVTSYGRSFAMAEAGCYGPECLYLGSADDSQATPGECTQTAGYIANAEILAIIANSSRVNQDYIDVDSNTNILVYDDTQWVGWMSDGIKSERKSVYQGLSMGGWTDWAIDLQEFQDVPLSSDSWTMFIEDAVVDVYSSEGNRTGNWTTLDCSNPAVTDALYMPCAQRWSELDASNAWSDALTVWLDTDEPELGDSEPEFTLSIMNTLHAAEEMNCGQIAPAGSCYTTETCAWFEGFGDDGGSGPAAMLIYDSFTIINSAYSQFYLAINGIAATYIDNQLAEFEDTFAPVPPTESDAWLDILIDLLGLGLTAVAAPFFDGVFGALPALEALGDSGAQVAQDMTYSAIAYGASIATSSLPAGAPDKWTAASQTSFTATMGSVLYGWSAAAENQLYTLFNGSSASITLLTTLISDGKLIEGSGASPETGYDPTTSTTTDVEGFIGTAFFGYAIPALWTAAGTAAFVIDSGYACSAQNPLTDYMTDSTQEATYACYNDNLYYLVYPDGTYEGCTGNDEEACSQSYFTAPPGLDTLSNATWGGITLANLIEGSVNTYVANGNANGGPVADPVNEDTLKDLANRDITTAGYIRLPVCSAQVAWASWSTPSQSNSSAAGYPCNPLQGVTKCSSYTYEDETTSASPSVSDCQTLMSNIAGTDGEWTTGISGQRAIATYGTCKFGVQNDGVTGDVTYYTGSQDIVTLVTEAISLYEWEGLVGAKGYMECDGDAGKQKVEWGLY
ncbi:Glycoside hydrolase superfamily [Penicillium verhagenii]|uniref:Glycoside hydrolase superfamily n=1 Tax=Penicillium verhagenii TaxID=1562060 RepID=UPI002544ED2B|nr:Glycoside hydrolase superfamily [Penicillium verhagenii]KAJ5947147.1 Glycoside hydrolase superfamily [Penicillium verhagenii]